jgi:tetratricopeptide (TPR) repeat protein
MTIAFMQGTDFLRMTARIQRFHRFWLCWIIAGLFFAGCGPLWAAAPSQERRAEALQLYQEGLFQETGSGDLDAAQTIYRSLISQYPDYRDVASAALFHLGLLNEKSGDLTEARKNYQKLLTQFPEQHAMAKEAKQRLTLLEKKFAEVTLPVSAPALQAPTLPALVPAVIQAAPLIQAPEPLAGIKANNQHYWGIGLHTWGVQAQYNFPTSEMVELRLQREANEPQLGVRLGMRLWTGGELPLGLYTGVESTLRFPGYAVKSYGVGAFTGCEWQITPFWGFRADVGYSQEWYTDRSGDRIRLLYQAGIMRYFY